MRYLVAASMVVLSGGAHALRGMVVDEDRLHKPEELLELGAITPLPEAGAVSVTKGSATDRIKQLEAELEALKASHGGDTAELDELRALKNAMTDEEVATIEARIDEAKAKVDEVNAIKALNKADLQAKAKELGIEFTTRTTVAELLEAVLAKS